MKLAYNYRALGSTGEVKGIVFASRKAFARATLRKMGLEPKAVSFAPLQTLSGSLSEEFDPAQLEQFYRYLARLESKGVARSSSLADAVSTTSDMRLRSALATMNEAITGKGMKVHQAMSMAGFPERDCSLVSAVEDKVTIDKVLIALADELKRTQDLRRSINKMLMMPKVMFFIGVILFYVNLVYAAPKIYTLFTTVMTQVELPEYARVYYEAASQFNKNAVIGTILYVAAIVGLVLLGRSGVLTRFINLLGPVRIARQKADYAALWGSFSLLYSVGEHREEIFRKLAKSATTKEARLGFVRMAQLVREGREIDQAIAVARFPLYIVNPVIAGQRSASLVETTKELSEKLIIDLDVFGEKAKVAINVFLTVAVAGFVLLFAMVTIIPMLFSIFSAV